MPTLTFRLSFEGTTARSAPLIEFDAEEIEKILTANGYRNLRHAGRGAYDHSWLCDDDRETGYHVASVLAGIVRRRVFELLTAPEK
jgi:hypothetical protein